MTIKNSSRISLPWISYFVSLVAVLMIVAEYPCCVWNSQLTSIRHIVILKLADGKISLNTHKILVFRCCYSFLLWPHTVDIQKVHFHVWNWVNVIINICTSLGECHILYNFIMSLGLLSEQYTGPSHVFGIFEQLLRCW